MPDETQIRAEPLGIIDIAKSLVRAPIGNREFDVQIAQFFGWHSVKVMKKNPGTGEPHFRMSWAPAGSDNPSKLPHFTTSIQSAMKLAEQECPGLQIGLSWETGTASALIDGRKPVQARTPAIALCLAVIVYRQATRAPENVDSEED